MEIVEILQLILLLGLVLSFSYLILNVRKVRRPHDMPEKDDETKKREMRLLRGRMALARRWARYPVGG